MNRRPPISTLFPNTTLSRSDATTAAAIEMDPIAAAITFNMRLHHLEAVVLQRERADALAGRGEVRVQDRRRRHRSEEHTSELQSRLHLVCRLLLGTKEHTSELQSRLHLVCRLLLESKKHTSELQSRLHLVCLLLLELKKNMSEIQSRQHIVLSTNL